MNQYAIRVAIFDQESFVETLGSTVEIISIDHYSWNYEDVIFETKLTSIEFSNYLDEAFEGQLDWGYIEDDMENDRTFIR